MEKKKREQIINQLDRSFKVMPPWAQRACWHAMSAPKTNPETGAPFSSFRECIEIADDHTLEVLRDDFDDNGDLITGE